MELLFRREQSSGRFVRVNFKLWGKIELDADEQAIVKRYKFNEAILIEAIQPELWRKTLFVGIGAFVLIYIIFTKMATPGTGLFLGLIGGGFAGWIYLDKMRGMSMAQAARDLDIHPGVLRRWVLEYSSHPGEAFPGQGQMRPDDKEVQRLRREVSKLKAERDILN